MFCNNKDMKVITLQEMPERTSAVQLPISVHVIIKEDMNANVKIGDKVEVTGVFKGLVPDLL
jgi:DNA replicative helicase MCM subunit Mcm2 (Cdc46/Mcm family)